MPRFQIDPQNIHDGCALLDKKESHHAISVLRLKPGNAVDLIDGKGHSFKGKVAGIRDGRLDIRIESSIDALPVCPSANIQITLAVSAIKSERMEVLIRKACELGAHSMIPVRSERSIIRLSRERWEEKIKRWRKIAAESCKQCGLAAIPQISEAVDFRNLVINLKDFDQVLIPTLAVMTDSLYDTLNRSALGRVLVLIGPEGDFTKKEVELAVTGGAVPVNLGPLVLRTETAATYVLSVLNFFYREIYKKRESQ